MPTKTRLTNDLRRRTANRILHATFRDRVARRENAESALALRILRRELGEDGFVRITQIDPTWLPMTKDLYFANYNLKFHTLFAYGGGQIYQTHLNTSLTLANAAPLPAFVAEHRLEVGSASVVELDAFTLECAALVEEFERLSKQVVGTLGGFYHVEDFAAEWPEGYAHFPHPELAPTSLPAFRVEDLNARIAAAREAA